MKLQTGDTVKLGDGVAQVLGEREWVAGIVPRAAIVSGSNTGVKVYLCQHPQDDREEGEYVWERRADGG